MTRQTSARVAANNNNRNEAKAMSFVDAFSPELPGTYARKMLEVETRGNGDQINALERVGRRCGMSARAVRRLVNGETKDPSFSMFLKIRRGFLHLYQEQIAKLQHELAVAEARFGSDHFEDIGAAAEALAARIEAEKERLG